LPGPWKNIREDKDAYNAEKEKTSSQVLERLNDVWPGIKDKVEMTDVATPHTWWRFTRNRQGAFEGFAIRGVIFFHESGILKKARFTVSGVFDRGQGMIQNQVLFLYSR
jgi:phytoene dehydrogenase-like protein